MEGSGAERDEEAVLRPKQTVNGAGGDTYRIGNDSDGERIQSILIDNALSGLQQRVATRSSYSLGRPILTPLRNTVTIPLLRNSVTQ